MQCKVECCKQTMTKKIKHAGVIENIEGSLVRVKIVQTSACASCKVANHCNASEKKEKLIDIRTNAAGLCIGQPVTISTSGASASHAVIIGFVLPLALLFGTLFALKAMNHADETAALWAMGVLIPYYISIWLLRERIEKSISFQLEEETCN